MRLRHRSRRSFARVQERLPDRRAREFLQQLLAADGEALALRIALRLPRLLPHSQALRQLGKFPLAGQ